MKILLCHNYYQEPGGEDQVFADESGLLEAHGHRVIRITMHNKAIARMGRWAAARKTLWNRRSYQRLRKVIRRERPDLMHCTNTFPLLSPSTYYAARAEGLPVVQSLHNYRLLCLAGPLLRDGEVCEECVGKRLPWPGVLRGCYRGSRAASAVVAAMLSMHRAAKTWLRSVQCFIALSEFARRKFAAGGLPPQRITVKPNFVHPDPGAGTGQGGYAVFVGRLAHEKGIDCLLTAWSRMRLPLRLKIAGDGPLAPAVRDAATRDPRIEWLGWRPPAAIFPLIGAAALLVLPSVCYETFGKAIIEAYAKGTPVLVSRHGAMAELVEDGRTGVRFTPGDPDDLAAKLQSLAADEGRLAAMRRAARQEYEDKYTADMNYRMLMAVYDGVLGAPRPSLETMPCPAGATT